ncbi:MAG: elongation factor G [Fimbriimonas ginsengisoli]|uniref:Elongation factor G n=1 Tax=Fimbriimonas ginsengisoli TaxID=1005039 RepID=A0A931PTQ6_FIMGI|nr:elongation factor G [Fimbriimonas ginsengisoli]
MKQYAADKIRNVAVVGHGGSGKSMLVEHMLYTAGATERVGSIEAGTTQSDFDPLEIRRKISLNMTVLPLEWHGFKINLIDVPGYPDFIGDLYAVAPVVESMILVTEAKADLDVGFELAWDIAERYNLAKCIFVNKLERDNADYPGLLTTLTQRYGNKVVGVQIPIGHQAAFSGVLDLLNMKVYKGKDRGAEIEDVPTGYQTEADVLREKMMDAAAEGDDELMMKYLDGKALTEDEIEHGLLVGVERGRVVPILLGSAASGIGVATLLDRIVHEMPSPADVPKTFGDKTLAPKEDGPLAAFCFRSTADPYVGKINFMRVYSGSLKADQHVFNVTRDREERLHNLFMPHGKGQEPTTAVSAGDICAIAKLTDTHTGDTLTTTKDKIVIPPTEFPEPIYRVAVVPNTKADEDKLGTAIQRLLEEDPTFRHSRDATAHQEILEGMGDIHIETIIEKLKAKFGVNVSTQDARVPYRETVKSAAKAQGRHKRQTGGKGQFGDCWIELEPLGRGTGFVFDNKVVGGSIPRNFIPAVEKGIREAMDHGLVAGYPVVDIRATVYDGSYHDVDSNEQAFKMAGAIALRAAAEKAGTVILEPMLNVEVEVPDECVGDVVGDLNGRRGRLQGMDPSAPGKTSIRATVPMATMMRYALDLRSITKGRGWFRQTVSHYDELPHLEQQAQSCRSPHGTGRAYDNALQEAYLYRTPRMVSPREG